MRGRDKDLDCADRGSAATGMHFQVRIAAELIDPDQLAVPQSDRFQRLAGFSASIAPGLPPFTDQFTHPVRARTGSHGLAEVGSFRRIETQVPHAVRGHAAPVAGRTERLRGRRDDTERCPVRQKKPLSRRGPAPRQRNDRTKIGRASCRERV